MRNLTVLFVALLILAGCASAPTSTPTPTATNTPTSTPTHTPTSTPTVNPTSTPTGSVTSMPTETATTTGNLPDLIVTRAQNSFEPRHCFSSLSRAKIIVFIYNQGLNQSGIFEVSINGEVVSSTEALAPGDEIELQAEFGLNTTQIEVEIDPENAIAESDETNNTFTGVVLTLTPPAPCTPTPTP
jgi:hypothetical protein